MNTLMTRPAMPWWRVPTMWFVTGAPALAVVASIALLVTALRHGDPPLRLPSAAATAAPGATEPTAMTPATQARNHAVSPAR